MAAQPREHVIIDTTKCKGCGLCMDACPPKCLDFEPELNAYGVRPAPTAMCASPADPSALPLIEHPDVLIAMTELSLRKLLRSSNPAGGGVQR